MQVMEIKRGVQDNGVWEGGGKWGDGRGEVEERVERKGRREPRNKVKGVFRGARKGREGKTTAMRRGREEHEAGEVWGNEIEWEKREAKLDSESEDAQKNKEFPIKFSKEKQRHAFLNICRKNAC